MVDRRWSEGLGTHCLLETHDHSTYLGDLPTDLAQLFGVAVAHQSGEVSLGIELPGRACAMLRNRMNSARDALEAPSAMFETIETAARRICWMSPNRSLLGIAPVSG